MNTEDFIRKAKDAHGGKYDYSKVEYERPQKKVCIICHRHGEFWQGPYHHLSGEGCPKCAEEARVSKLTKPFAVFLEKAKMVHGDRYVYVEDSYKNSREKMEMVCTVCGTRFKQTPSKHLIGQGCMVCYKSGKPNNKLSADAFEGMASDVHGGKYSYIHDFTNTKDKVTIVCPIHGEFKQEAQSHLQGHGCPKCALMDSKGECEIYDYVCSLVGKDSVVRKANGVIGRRELDIYIPSLSVAIEYNGLRWHSDKFRKDKNYHLEKLVKCNQIGIRLMQIFEDEWLEKKEIVMSKIRHILGLNRGTKVYARNCIVTEIDKNDARDFLNDNHIQGFVRSSKYLGAFYDGRLVAVMSFLQTSHERWELTRFASDINKRCIGVGGKLFKAFVSTYKPSYVKSFADRRWTLSEENNLYIKLGFKLSSRLRPDYRYVNGKKREHKFNYRKNILHKKYGVPLGWTEREMTECLGFYRVYDCGLLKYELEFD